MRKKVAAYLDLEDYNRVLKISKDNNISMSEIIQQAIKKSKIVDTTIQRDKIYQLNLIVKKLDELLDKVEGNNGAFERVALSLLQEIKVSIENI